MRRDGTFWHEGVRIAHPKLHAAFRAGVRWAEVEQTFVVQLGRFRGWLDVEDTAFFVDGYDEASGEIAVSDRVCEPLDVSSLVCDGDGAWRCSVRARFAARFTRAAQAELLSSVENEGGRFVLRAAGARLALPAALGF